MPPTRAGIGTQGEVAGSEGQSLEPWPQKQKRLLRLAGKARGIGRGVQLAQSGRLDFQTSSLIRKVLKDALTSWGARETGKADPVPDTLREELSCVMVPVSLACLSPACLVIASGGAWPHFWV